ncbi:MAG TPA: hypothetical protein VH913_16475 [Hyphomicrobiaceae bacterium]
MAAPEVIELRENLGAPAAMRNVLSQLVVRGGAHHDVQAVVGEDLEGLDIVGGAAGLDRMHAARVVTDHAAQCVVVVRRRIGSEGQVMLLGGRSQVVENAPRLDLGRSGARIDGAKAVEVFREVDQDGNIAALPGQARAAAARDDGRIELAAQPDGPDDVLAAPGHHDADRHLSVVRSVGGIERTAAGVEADLPVDDGGERASQSAMVGLWIAGKVCPYAPVGTRQGRTPSPVGIPVVDVNDVTHDPLASAGADLRQPGASPHSP